MMRDLFVIISELMKESECKTASLELRFFSFNEMRVYSALICCKIANVSPIVTRSKCPSCLEYRVYTQDFHATFLIVFN